MGIVRHLRTWWQLKTGEDDTPFDRDAQAWLVSLVFHLILLIAVAVISIYPDREQIVLTLVSPREQMDTETLVAEDFHFVPELVEEVGADSLHGFEMAVSASPTVVEISARLQAEEEWFQEGPIAFNEAIDIAAGPNFSKNRLIKGRAGVGTTGAVGAIDRITHEILLSLDERKTLVVWLFDQSGSLMRQRDTIRRRFDRIYKELGVIESSGNEAFEKHRDKPLLTSVMAFGQNISFRTKKPTDDLDAIKAAVAGIELDGSGIEYVFEAIYTAADRFKTLRRTVRGTGEPARNVMFVVVSDEAGDDQARLDTVVDLCRRLEIPVYVIGVPAPFGRRETLIKWVDPDPKYDQRPQWGRVSQGPESLWPERIRIHFGDSRERTAAIDSGFGPFALTRLCYETGGIYFAVHPSRHVNRAVGRRETAEFSAHFEHFFDPEVMRRYRPDYVSAAEYRRRLKENRARAALVRAAEASWLAPMARPRTRFVKSNDATFATELTEAQKDAAKLQPTVESVYQTIKLGEVDREKESVRRWQAGFDLAMGRAIAIKVRTESYNAMLAKAKRGMKFKDEKNNTWRLRSDDDLSVGSQLSKLAENSKTYLQRVVQDHPGTPWALLAQRELKLPLGWRWTEHFTDLNPPRQRNGGNANRNRSDDRRRMLPRPKPKRPVPRL